MEAKPAHETEMWVPVKTWPGKPDICPTSMTLTKPEYRVLVHDRLTKTYYFATPSAVNYKDKGDYFGKGSLRFVPMSLHCFPTGTTLQTYQDDECAEAIKFGNANGCRLADIYFCSDASFKLSFVTRLTPDSMERVLGAVQMVFSHAGITGVAGIA